MSTDGFDPAWCTTFASATPGVPSNPVVGTEWFTVDNISTANTVVYAGGASTNLNDLHNFVDETLSVTYWYGTGVE
jgi:hypothetical protein